MQGMVPGETRDEMGERRDGTGRLVVGLVAGGGHTHGQGLREVMERGLLLPGEYKEQMKCWQEALPGVPGKNPGTR